MRQRFGNRQNRILSFIIQIADQVFINSFKKGSNDFSSFVAKIKNDLISTQLRPARASIAGIGDCRAKRFL